MINLFDSDNYPEKEPARLTAGYQWAWKRPDITGAYPTVDYTLKYTFNALFEVNTEVFTAQKTGGEHVLIAAPVDTDINAGDYRWQAVVVRDSDSAEVVVDESIVTVTEKDGAISSHVYKTLLAIRATIEGNASQSQQSYSIAGRSLTRYSHDELIKLEQEYAERWEKEKANIAKANGRSSINTVKVKMRA